MCGDYTSSNFPESAFVFIICQFFIYEEFDSIFPLTDQLIKERIFSIIPPLSWIAERFTEKQDHLRARSVGSIKRA